MTMPDSKHSLRRGNAVRAAAVALLIGPLLAMAAAPDMTAIKSSVAQRHEASIKELQGCLDAFRTWYDREREHSSLDYRMPEAVHHA